jgi:hypothetical protein
MTPGDQFYRGTIKEPEGPGERVVVGKATKALAERMAVKAAQVAGWDWLVEHCRVVEEGASVAVVVIEHWSSVDGYQAFEVSVPT